MKKVVRYLQKQAVQYSDEKYSGAAYLSPRRNREPQEHGHNHSQHNEDIKQIIGISPTMPANQRRTSSRRTPVSTRISSNIQRVQYASENILQSYEIFLPEPPSSTSSSSPHGSGASTPLTPGSSVHTPAQKYWVVFIHGGYFRDPSVLASSLHPTLDVLTDPNTPDTSIRELQHHVKGYVSINYRLAQHEAHPQNPDTTPSYEMRNARWPEMLTDVLGALKHWQGKHPEVGERYLLVGHSVGATLALNALLHANEHGVTPPLGTVTVNGIYDFITLHQAHPEYRSMTANAIDEAQWESVSPARHSKRRFEDAWTPMAKPLSHDRNGPQQAGRRKRWIVLAHSKVDGLVDWDQAEAMSAVLERDDGGAEEGLGEVTVMSEMIEIKGRHNACWEDGKELARVIREGVGEIMGVDQ